VTILPAAVKIPTTVVVPLNGHGRLFFDHLFLKKLLIKNANLQKNMNIK
jgi:hypothetical protein